MSKNIGIYIHVPFCDGKCNYCDFFSFKADNCTLDKYTSAMCDKIKAWSQKLNYNKIDTVYFGGGTPSVLGTDRLVRILNSIHNSFRIASDCEITLEANPMSAKLINFVTLKNSGINRVSLGMQSAVDNELKLLGRRHSKADVIDTISNIKESGIDNISLDVMLGIPQQSTDSLLDTLEFCINMDVSHISTYLLSLEPNTHFGRNSDKFDFADDDMQAELYSITSDYLKSMGFEHYEISNFCRDNKYSRHNMRYWQLKDYLGLGPSAHSLIDDKRFYYPRSLDDFYNDVIADEGNGNTKNEYIMLMLRTAKGIDIAEYEALFKEELSKEFMNKARFYKTHGYVKISDNHIMLTEKGFLLSNTIIADLI